MTNQRYGTFPYPTKPKKSLESLFRNHHTHHVKLAAYKIKQHIHQYVDDYKRGISILDLAKQANFPPTLLCRYIVEQITTTSKKGLSKAIRDPWNVLGNITVIKEAYVETEQQFVSSSSSSSTSSSTTTWTTKISGETE